MEITQEWLDHLGVPEDLIPDLARQESIDTDAVYMPFITAYFLRDRKNLAEKPLPTRSPAPEFLTTRALKELEGAWLEDSHPL